MGVKGFFGDRWRDLTGLFGGQNMDPYGPGQGGPGVMGGGGYRDPGMMAQPGGFQQGGPGFQPGGPDFRMGFGPKVPPVDPDEETGSGFGRYLTGDTAQVIAGGLSGLGAWHTGRMQRQSAEDELELMREKHAFQQQKYDDERKDREARHKMSGPRPPINWRQY